MSRAPIENLKEDGSKDVKGSMCDKISHLTRIVFMLHCKNEESEAVIASIIGSYEKELYNVVRESNAALNLLKTKVKEINALNESKSNEQAQAIELKYSNALNSFVLKYNQFKNEAYNRIVALQQEGDDRMKQMQLELSSMKRANDARIREISKKNDEENKQLKDSKAKEVSRLNQDMISLKKSSDKRVEELENECKAQVDKYKTEAKKAKTEREEISKDFNERVTSFKTQIAINESNINIINSQLANANKELSYYKDKDKEKSDRIKQYELSINDQIARSQQKVKELNEEIVEYKTQMSKYAQIEQQLSLKEAFILQLEKEKQAAILKENELKQSLDSLINSLASNEMKLKEAHVKNSSLNKAVDDLNRETDAWNKKLSANSENENKLKVLIEALKNEMTAKEKQLTQQYDAFISNLKKTANEDKREHEEKRRKLENSHQVSTKALNETIAQLNINLKKNEDDHIINEKEKKQMKDNHNKEISDLKETYAAQIDELKTKLNKNSNSILEKANQQLKAMKQAQLEEISSLESKHREEINRNTFQNSLNYNELQLKLDSQISTLKIENIQLRERVTDLEKDKHDMSSLHKLKPNFSSYPPKKIAELENTISSLRKELLIRESEREKRKEEFKQAQRDLIERMKREFADAMNVLQEKNRNLLNEISEFKLLIDNKPDRQEGGEQSEREKKDKEDKGMINKSLEEGSKIASGPPNQLKRNGSDFNSNMKFFINNAGLSTTNKRGTIMSGVRQLRIKQISNKSLTKTIR